MDIAPSNRAYWNRRAQGYSQLNQEQFHGGQVGAWADALEGPLRSVPARGDSAALRVLDVGCGPGFFSLLLAKGGHCVTGVDYTPNMLEQARRNARAEGLDVTFVEADARRLPFGDESFDAVVSRNVTWNLPNPEACYAEWRRVLAPGGVVVNFASTPQFRIVATRVPLLGG